VITRLDKKTVIKIKTLESGCELINPAGDVFCRIDRDEDSACTAMKVLESLGHNVEIVDD